MPEVWRENEVPSRRECNLVLITVEPRLSDTLKYRDGLQIGCESCGVLYPDGAEPYWP